MLNVLSGVVWLYGVLSVMLHSAVRCGLMSALVLPGGLC